LRSKSKANSRYFSTLDIVFIGVFSALWAALNLSLGPLGFSLLHLPVFCDVSAYLTLLLAVWVFGKFGGASVVGVIGSLVVLLFRPNATHIFGFAASAVIFDVLFLTIQHRPPKRALTLIASTLITVVSAYFAGVIIGLVFMAKPLGWALTFWGGWHAVGGLLAVIITLPVIGALERTGVRRLIRAD